MDGALRRASFERFVAAVAERLDQGERQYHGRTFELPASSIIAEAQAELLDNAAYSFIAWCRLEWLRQEVDRTDLQGVAEHEQHEDGAEARVQHELREDHPLGVIGGKLDQVSEVSDRAAHGREDTPSRQDEKARGDGGERT